MTGDKPPLAMTMGDPAGIGPELALAAWRESTPSAPFFVLAAPAVLAAAARRVGFEAPIIETDPAAAAAQFAKGVPVVPLAHAVEAEPGRPSAAQCGRDDRIDCPRGRGGPQRPGARSRDQSDRQGRAL